MTGGRASRQKGNRVERALVHALQDAGFAAERVPLSGAARGRFGGDLSVPLLGIDRRVEVKAHATGFRQLYEWVGRRRSADRACGSLSAVGRAAAETCR